MKNTTSLQYENRRGDLYYLQEGKTSTGKPKYYAARKLTGVPLEALPDGYAIYERPENAQVVVRKVKPSPITEFERRQAEDKWIKRSQYTKMLRFDLVDPDKRTYFAQRWCFRGSI